jgi:hypothetical protein
VLAADHASRSVDPIRRNLAARICEDWFETGIHVQWRRPADLSLHGAIAGTGYGTYRRSRLAMTTASRADHRRKWRWAARKRLLERHGRSCRRRGAGRRLIVVGDASAFARANEHRTGSILPVLT